MREPDDDIRSLEALEQRLQRAREQNAPQDGGTKPAGKEYSLALNLAIELAAGVLVGAGAGIALDRWLDTSPVALLICLALGIAASARTVYRLAMRDDAVDAEEKKNNE